MAKKKHTFVLTDESVNGYGYRVLTSGGRKEQFLKNPVMLYSHEYGLLPIGTFSHVPIGRIWVVSILYVTLAHDTDVADNLDRQLTQLVVVSVAECL